MRAHYSLREPYARHVDTCKLIRPVSPSYAVCFPQSTHDLKQLADAGGLPWSDVVYFFFGGTRIRIVAARNAQCCSHLRGAKKKIDPVSPSSAACSPQLTHDVKQLTDTGIPPGKHVVDFFSRLARCAPATACESRTRDMLTRAN